MDEEDMRYQEELDEESGEESDVIKFGEWLMINASPWAYGDGWLVFKDRSVCTTTQTYGIFKAEQKEKK